MRCNSPLKKWRGRLDWKRTPGGLEVKDNRKSGLRARYPLTFKSASQELGEHRQSPEHDCLGPAAALLVSVAGASRRHFPCEMVGAIRLTLVPAGVLGRQFFKDLPEVAGQTIWLSRRTSSGEVKFLVALQMACRRLG